MSVQRRVEVLLEDPNSLFQTWLNEFLDVAVRKNSKSRYRLREAIESLKRFPLPLATGRDCAILKGFGPKLCSLIDAKLEEYKKTCIADYNKSINYSEDVQKVARKYKRKKQPIVEQNLGSCDPKSTSNGNENGQVVMSSGSFDIILLVDTQETNGKTKKYLDDTRLFLNSQKITYEVRRLPVGDYCWISRDKAGKELVLPYIIERKRMDDFACSIRDGRFHEQKFRLKDCGIQNLIYLIENHGNNQHVGLPVTTLLQAATNTHIHSGFHIKFTDTHRDTILYVSTLTNILIENYKDKVLIQTPKIEIQPTEIQNSFVGLMAFNEFNTQSTKNKDICVKEIFIKQLLQLKSLSVDKALAITELYPTPKSLLLAYDACLIESDKEKLLANIPSGKLRRPVGIFISKTICQLYTNK